MSGNAALLAHHKIRAAESVARSQLALRISADAEERVLEQRVVKAGNERFDKGHNVVKICTVTLCKRAGGFDERAGEDVFDLTVGCDLIYVVVFFEISEICHERVTHVVDQELALDKEIKGAENDHAVDLWRGRADGTEAERVCGQLAVKVGAYGKGILRQKLFGCGRNGDADRHAHKADLVKEVALCLLGDEGLYKTAQILVRADKVFADENIERLSGALASCEQAACNEGSDVRQHVYAESGRHDIAGCDLVYNGVVVSAVYCGAVFDPLGNILGALGDVYGVLARSAQLFDHIGVYVNKNGVIAGKVKSFSDKTSADVAGAIHKSFFHCVFILS